MKKANTSRACLHCQRCGRPQTSFLCTSVGRLATAMPPHAGPSAPQNCGRAQHPRFHGLWEEALARRRQYLPITEPCCSFLCWKKQAEVIPESRPVGHWIMLCSRVSWFCFQVSERLECFLFPRSGRKMEEQGPVKAAVSNRGPFCSFALDVVAFRLSVLFMFPFGCWRWKPGFLHPGKHSVTQPLKLVRAEQHQHLL